MHHNIRSVDTGRYGLAFFIFLLAVTVCLGQEPPATQKAAGAEGTKQEAPAQASTTPPPVPDAAAPTAPATVPKPPEVTESKPVEEQPATGKAKSKGRAPKNAKGSVAGRRPEVTATGVDEKPYIIGPEDILGLNVLHQQDVSQTLVVRPDGFVSVRFANEIKAAGLTTQQLADIITEKLTQYFNHPEVNIQVIRILSKKYSITGEVRKPGVYNLSTPKTIYEALIEAGGLADFAKKGRIYVLRGQDKIPFNFTDVNKGKNLGQNIRLENGDVIVVP
jgi:polysaccharide export outer membrane protein